MNIHFPAGLGDLLVGGVLLGVADVLLDGTVEEHGLLPHDPHLVPQPPHVQLFQVGAVNEHLGGNSTFFISFQLACLTSDLMGYEMDDAKA